LIVRIPAVAESSFRQRSMGARNMDTFGWTSRTRRCTSLRMKSIAATGGDG